MFYIIYLVIAKHKFKTSAISVYLKQQDSPFKTSIDMGYQYYPTYLANKIKNKIRNLYSII